MKFLIREKKYILLYTVLLAHFKGQHFQQNVLAAEGLREGKLELDAD